MPRMRHANARQPRSIVVLFGILAAALVVVIADLAVSVRPPAPPSIAEFAPQAVEQIKAPPRQQETGGASGSQGAAVSARPSSSSARPSTSAGHTSASPTASSSTAPPVDETRVKQCSALTQTQNPQSAHCVNYFASTDNGGATAPGVSRDEIRVGYMPTGSVDQQALTNLVTFFNQKFQFYGRTITLVPFATNLDASSNDPAVENAAAASAKEQDLFAVLGPSYQAADWSSFYDAMARDHVITVAFSGELNRTTAEFVANRPYEWSFDPSTDSEEQALANWACTTLAGKKAQFGGDDVSSHTRKFGIVVQSASGRTPSTAALTQGLAGCHATPDIVTLDPSTADDTTVQTALARLNSDGVTSIFLLGDARLTGTLVPSATTLDYHPEWLTGTFGQGSGNDFRLEGFEQGPGWGTPYRNQINHMFGLWPLNRPLGFTNSWYTQAELEINPAYGGSYVSQQGDLQAAVYNALQLLANGIQLAGPKLTPDSFEKGLLGATFPNPRAGENPYYQSGYGFGAGDYTASNDYAVVWWDRALAPFNFVQGASGPPLTGSFCMVGRGQRFSSGNWPPETSLFNRSAGCR